MQKRFHWAWIILIVSFLNTFISYGIRLGYGVLMPEMIQAIGISRTQAGMIFNAYILGYVIFSPLTGRLTDRYGARRIITIFSALLGVGTILMGTVNQFETAALFFMLVGISSSAMWNPPLTVIQHWFAANRRGFVIGILGAGPGLGFALSGWLYPRIVESLSWRWCWYFFGISALVMILVNATLLRSKPQDIQLVAWGEDHESEREKLDTEAREVRMSSLRKSGTFWTIGISFCLASFALYLVTTFLVDYINLELRFTFETASQFAMLHGIAQVIGVLTIPILSDRIGRRITLIITNLFCALSITGIIFSGQNLPFLYANVLIFGVFYGVIWPMYGACSGDYFRGEIVGTVLGAWTIFYGIGSISGHIIGGFLRDATGSFTAAFIISVLSVLLAAIIMQRMKKPKTLEHQII